MLNMFKKKYLDLILYSILTYLALGAIYPERFIFAEIKFTSNHTLANIYQAALFHTKYIANLNFEDYVEIDRETRILTKKLINK